MTQTPAGWYPDPHPQAPRGSLRYWDGTQWTPHAAPPPPGEREVTPDGVRLAGWWQRVGAYLLDGLITGVTGVLLGLPFFLEMMRSLGDYVDRAFEAAESGEQVPTGPTDVYAGHLGAVLAFVAIATAVAFAYHVLFLRLRGATLGMSALGIAVRRREEPGPLPWATVAARVGAQYGPGLLGLVPYAGKLVGLYMLLDDLWPLWDRRRQALHDKVAGTQVVRTR